MSAQAPLRPRSPRSGVTTRLLRKLRPASPPCVACGGIPTTGDYQWDWFGRAYCLCDHCREPQPAASQPSA